MKALAVAIAATLGMSSASAVILSVRGTGEVLIYPYYTVNNQQTLVSVVNTTNKGKALKVRFREAYNGRSVADFDLYLGAYDTCVGSVFDTSPPSGGAAIATTDSACTVPAFDPTYFSNGPAVLVFSNRNYSQGGYTAPQGSDTGPTTLSRTREGFFEIIEMGVIVDQAADTKHTVEAITAVNGFDALGHYLQAKPPKCSQVVGAWNQGYWSTAPKTDLLPPSGGLYGAAGIVNVAAGTL